MNLEKCPGYYCSRMPLGNETYSDCGACDRGWKRNDTVCVKCEENLSPYDFLFLAFNSIIPLLIHLFLIDFTTKTPKKYVKCDPANNLINKINFIDFQIPFYSFIFVLYLKLDFQPLYQFFLPNLDSLLKFIHVELVD